ncbi:hypothetical protein [Gluconobacter oxydans]|nr:hypothetical protein [Gluconobacter oxydans]
MAASSKTTGSGPSAPVTKVATDSHYQSGIVANLLDGYFLADAPIRK